jgi:hypothetical protein
MKANKLFIIILALFLVACNDLLIEKPRDIMDPAQFFNSDAEAIGAVNGIYSRGIKFAFNSATVSNFGYVSHQGTDISRPAGGRESNYSFHVYTLSSAEDGSMRESWATFFRTIADANMVIARIEASKGNFSTNGYNQSIGQAKFLRAYFYWMLTNYWGDVPMWLNELDINAVANLPRTPIAEIRKQMVLDLTDASNKLPVLYTGADLGRATKWAAMMLLTKVYMTQGDWANAKTTVGKIINESPHRLMPDYGKIFGLANEYNLENIWEIDAKQDLNPSLRASWFTPRATDMPKLKATAVAYTFTGYGLLTSTDEFIASFDPTDKRMPFYNFNGVYDDPEGDGIYTHWVPFSARYVLKFIDWGSPRNNSGLNAIVYRLAEAYLLYAEAENELNGPTTEAYAKINAIRDRAFGNNPLKRLSGLTKEGFRQAIMDESKWELGFEFQRRWDLNRWGKLGEAVHSISKTNPIGAANFKPYHVLFPIPFQEISLNPALKQNPGY